MNIKEKIEQLEKELSELKEQVNKRKLFYPKENEEYYLVMGDGYIDRRIFVSTYERYLIRGRLFATREEAEFFAEKELVLLEIQRYADEYNQGEIDWNNRDKKKYFLYYDHAIDRINAEEYCFMQLVGTYFTSRQIALDCIEQVGKERIKKYLFGKE